MVNSLPRDTFHLYLVDHAVYLLYRERWSRTASALTGFICFSNWGIIYSQQLDLFESQTTFEMCVAIQRSGSGLNHTALWMDPRLLFVHLSFLFVCQICSQCQGEGHCQVAQEPTKSNFLCTIHITNGHCGLAPCLGRTVKFNYFLQLRCRKCVRPS